MFGKNLELAKNNPTVFKSAYWCKLPKLTHWQKCESSLLQTIILLFIGTKIKAFLWGILRLLDWDLQLKAIKKAASDMLTALYFQSPDSYHSGPVYSSQCAAQTAKSKKSI